MATEGGTKAIVAALLANTGIAIAKFVAFLGTGSSAMLAESVHSLADAGNQVLLLVGGRRSKREASASHPFGYGRTRYVYAFIVAIILFTVGGMFSIYEGVNKIQHPHGLENWWWAIGVLAVAIVLESFSLRTAVRESNHVRGKQSWVEFVRRAKSPELPVILLEDIAALLGLTFAFVGVGLAVITGNPIFDAIGTLAIGLLLILVAVILGIEMASLLVGEGANPDDVIKIRDAINAHPKVEALIHMKTLYVGPEELLVGAKIALAKTAKLQDVAAAINDVEESIRAAVPVARIIYLEPDVYIAKGSEPSTDAIVIKGTD
jgi:cation diffusion facilitator family transporter